MRTLVGCAVLAALLAAAGSAAERAKPAPPTTPSRPAAAPLPEWAPKHPSREFLRAAKVLKPIPPEWGDANAEARALRARIERTYPAAYELFGTLTDAQVTKFLATKQLRLPVRSLPRTQRAVLDRWFEAYRRAMQGLSASVPLPTDYLVLLYKKGAREDLSNVDVGFATIPVGSSPQHAESTHRVHVWFWVRKPDGGAEQVGSQFAQI